MRLRRRLGYHLNLLLGKFYSHGIGGDKLGWRDVFAQLSANALTYNFLVLSLFGPTFYVAGETNDRLSLVDLYKKLQSKLYVTTPKSPPTTTTAPPAVPPKPGAGFLIDRGRVPIVPVLLATSKDANEKPKYNSVIFNRLMMNRQYLSRLG